MNIDFRSSRKILLVLCLATLLIAEAATFRRWELKRRIRLLQKTARLSVESAELDGSLYEFDPEFGSFLEGVRRLVPSGSSVAVSLPATTPLYLYTAHYALSPRPVVEARARAKADFLAVYKPGSRGAPGRAWAVPGGTVSLLR